MKESGYTIGDHPADLQLLARGRTLRELFSQAGRGVIEYTGPPKAAGPLCRREVRLRGADREELLVLWLNELIYLLETGFIPALPPQLDRLSGRELQTVLSGGQIQPGAVFSGPEIKAATYHQLAIKKIGRFWQARIILDL